MNQFQFSFLTPAEQQNTLWQNGFVMSIKKEKKFDYVLYCLYDFFVVLKYEGTEIKNIRSFKRDQQIPVSSAAQTSVVNDSHSRIQHQERYIVHRC